MELPLISPKKIDYADSICVTRPLIFVQNGKIGR